VRVEQAGNLHRHLFPALGGSRIAWSPRGGHSMEIRQGQGRGAGADSACSTRQIIIGTAANWPSSPTNWMTLAPTIWWSSDVLRTNELQVWLYQRAPGGYASGARRTTAATQCRLMQRIICGTIIKSRLSVEPALIFKLFSRPASSLNSNRRSSPIEPEYN